MVNSSGVARIRAQLVTAILACSSFHALSFRTENKEHSEGAKECKSETVCVISANQPTAHSAGLPGLFEGCLRADPTTSVVALALQDFPGGEMPHYVKHLEGLDKSARFKLRHNLVLSGATGDGHFCYSHFAGGVLAGVAAGAGLGFKVGLLAHIAGPIIGFSVKALTTVSGAIVGGVAAHFASSAVGMNCGGVAVAVYSLRKVGVDFGVDAEDVLRTLNVETTATTKKGTVAARFTINGQQLVIVSTHGSEGVRGKKRKKGCDVADAEAIEREQKRVNTFVQSLQMINELRHSEVLEGGAAGVVWAGDFNSRSVYPSGPYAGCPIWPAGDDPAADLDSLKQGRSVLGSDDSGRLVTFASVLEGQHLTEADNLVCPTYSKALKSDELDENGWKQFQCRENEQAPMMHYRPDKPPSWVDRIFHSEEHEWLQCGPLHRISHESDHDAVLLTCRVDAGSSCSESATSMDELAEEHNARCCCTNIDDCHILRGDDLVRSWAPHRWFSGKSFCPGGSSALHHYQSFGLDEMPEACLDTLDGITDVDAGDVQN